MLSVKFELDPQAAKRPYPCQETACFVLREAQSARDLSRTVDTDVTEAMRTLRAVLIAATILPSLIAWIALGLYALGFGWIAAIMFAFVCNAIAAVAFSRAALWWLRFDALPKTRRIAADLSRAD